MNPHITQLWEPTGLPSTKPKDTPLKLYTWPPCKKAGRSTISRFSRCCLRAWLPIILHLDAECNSSFNDTDKSWDNLKYRRPLRIKKAAWMITKVWEAAGSSDWQVWSSKKTTLLRLGRWLFYLITKTNIKGQEKLAEESSSNKRSR